MDSDGVIVLIRRYRWPAGVVLVQYLSHLCLRLDPDEVQALRPDDALRLAHQVGAVLNAAHGSGTRVHLEMRRAASTPS